jgi:hypothetical protein
MTTPEHSFADFDTQPRSALVDWLWRIPLLLRWDGILPFFSPTTVLTLTLLQVPQPVVCIIGVVVPICVALLRAGLAQQQIAQVCGNRGTLDRHLGVAVAIILLLVLEVTSTILVLQNAGLKDWAPAALLYVSYAAVISWALRPPPEERANDGI